MQLGSMLEMVRENQSVTQLTTSANLDSVDADPGVDDQSQDEDQDSAHPLLIFYDCETTGFMMTTSLISLPRC